MRECGEVDSEEALALYLTLGECRLRTNGRLVIVRPLLYPVITR
jgi:hypothetical protein